MNKYDKYEWKEIGDKSYFYDLNTGKIVGFSHKHAMSDIWYSVVYTGQYTFTVDDEKHLGQYINSSFARQSIEFYWEVQNRTLLEN